MTLNDNGMFFIMKLLEFEKAEDPLMEMLRR
jgi:hypothetical protein